MDKIWLFSVRNIDPKMHMVSRILTFLTNLCFSDEGL